MDMNRREFNAALGAAAVGAMVPVSRAAQTNVEKTPCVETQFSTGNRAFDEKQGMFKPGDFVLIEGEKNHHSQRIMQANIQLMMRDGRIRPCMGFTCGPHDNRALEDFIKIMYLSDGNSLVIFETEPKSVEPCTGACLMTMWSRLKKIALERNIIVIYSTNQRIYRNSQPLKIKAKQIPDRVIEIIERRMYNYFGMMERDPFSFVGGVNQALDYPLHPSIFDCGANHEVRLVRTRDDG